MYQPHVSIIYCEIAKNSSTTTGFVVILHDSPSNCHWDYTTVFSLDSPSGLNTFMDFLTEGGGASPWGVLISNWVQFSLGYQVMAMAMVKLHHSAHAGWWF